MNRINSFRRWWDKNASSFDVLIFDIDGTLITAGHALPGAGKLLSELRNSQFPFCLLTNDGNHSTIEKSSMMENRGLDVKPEEIISCGHALAPLAERRQYIGRPFFIMGELGNPDFAELAGIIPVRDPAALESCEGIIVGEGSYNWQESISAVINYFIMTDNRTMIVPNPDSYWPAGKNGEIGVGAGGKARFVCTILKEYGIKIKPLYLGKPYTPVFRFAVRSVIKRFGLTGRISHERVLMLGDSLFSDIRGAKRAGFRSGLMMTGITGEPHLRKASSASLPDFIFKSLE